MTTKILLTSAVMFFIITNSLLGEARGEVTKEEIGTACISKIKDETKFLHLHKRIKVSDKGVEKELILLRESFGGSGNGLLLALVKESGKCMLALTTEARGVEIKFKKGQNFPELHTDYSEGKDDSGIMIFEEARYVWNGKFYEERKDGSKTIETPEEKPSAVRKRLIPGTYR